MLNSINYQRIKANFKLLIFFLIILFSFGCEKSEKTQPQKISFKKQVYTLKSEEVSPEIKLTGNVEANKLIPISAKIAGRIDFLNVDIGDKVKKGQILARYSTLDNDSLVQFQGALSQLKSVEAAAKNSVNTAEVQVVSTKRNLEQVRKEEEMLRKAQYDNLYTNAKLSEITISNSLNFLDQKVEGSLKFRGTTTARMVGRNNTIMKNNLKNKVYDLVKKFSNIKKDIIKSEENILKFSKFRLNLLKEIKLSLLDFDSLVRETTVSSDFPQTNKDRLITEITTYLKQISTTITNLEKYISQTKVVNEQLGLKILSAENSLKTVQSNLELAKSNSENQIVAAKSQVNIAANYQKEMIVKAPFSGVITDRKIDIGQLVAPGKVLFNIADISGFKIKTDVADAFVGAIKLDMKVSISVDGLNESFTGIVSKVNPALDPKTRKLGIEISFIEDKEANFVLNQKLKIGLFARIKMKLPKREVFRVPKSFIKFDYDGAKIQLEDGTWEVVNILEEKGNNVEIYFNGIKDNLKIIKE